VVVAVQPGGWGSAAGAVPALRPAGGALFVALMTTATDSASASPPRVAAARITVRRGRISPGAGPASDRRRGPRSRAALRRRRHARQPRFEVWPTLLHPRIAYAVPGWPTRPGVVAAGLGISLIPELCAASVPDTVRVVGVDDPGFPGRRTVAITSTTCPPRPPPSCSHYEPRARTCTPGRDHGRPSRSGNPPLKATAPARRPGAVRHAAVRGRPGPPRPTPRTSRWPATTCLRGR